MLKLNYATTPEGLAVLMERMKPKKRTSEYAGTLFHFMETGNQIAYLSFQNGQKASNVATAFRTAAKKNCINVTVMTRGTEVFIINNNLKQEI